MNLPARKLQHAARDHLALHDRAIEDIRFIRETMERSTSFTAVSGRAGVLMGLVALGAAAAASSVPAGGTGWVVTWMAAAVVGLGVALVGSARKARAAGEKVLSGSGRKFLWSVTPPLVVGALVTVALAPTPSVGLLPGVWLLLYGTGAVTGGAFSVSIVPLMGFAFMGLGAVTLFAPAEWGNAFMALGFGGLHLVFGSIIWRKHGG